MITSFDDPVRVLDLYCGAGGAAYGIHLALPNADITGVDLVHQRRYPYRFVRADALEYAYEHGNEYDFIWASPPCQKYVVINTWHSNYDPSKYSDLVAATRNLLKLISKPWIIENVVTAPLREPTVLLCGTMFGLATYRHRKFETNPFILKNVHHPKHLFSMDGRDMFTVAGHAKGFIKEWRRALGIGWMTKPELRNAVPPAYSKFMTELVVQAVIDRRSVQDMPLQSKALKCTAEYHLFDIVKRRLGIRCRCGLIKQDFEYLQGYDLTIRVRVKKAPRPGKINFKDVN